jgi:adenylosuccinate lyase
LSEVIPRYTPPRIAAIFSDESRLRRWLEVELLAVEGWSAAGRVPAGAADRLRAVVRVDAQRVAALEAEQGHDVAAFVSAVQERAGDEGRYIHLGLTSSDVVDTALATQLRDAAAVLDEDAAALERALAELAVRHRLTLMPGRTHGVHAEPLTLGVKLAQHYDEVRRSHRRLAAGAREVSVGNLSGTVGTHISVPPQVEEHVCRALGLEVAPATTQVVARDRHAALLCSMAILGAVLERLATAIRLLQVTEVGELEEPFAQRQKGSSAMPHKRNPVLCERICGMARVLRGHALTGLEDVALWHERDISHSSAERIVLPDAFALLSYMLQLSTRVVLGLRVDARRMRANLDHGGGLVFSQRVLNALVETGWPRERAYRVVQSLATQAREGGGGFRDLVLASDDIRAGLEQRGVEVAAFMAQAFDIDAYLSHIDETYARLGLAVEPPQPDPVASAEQPALAVEAGLGGGQL